MRKYTDADDIEITMPFMLNDKPVIPGSSLRGMIRAIVEIITFGKMHFVDDANKIFFRAVAAENNNPLKKPYADIMGELNSRTHAGKKVRAGYLRLSKENIWSIQPAQNFGGDSFAIVKEKDITGVDGFRPFNDNEYQVTSFDVCYKEMNGKRGKWIGDVWSPKPHESVTATLVCTGNMKETNESGESPRKCFTLVRQPLPGKLLQIPNEVIEDYKKGLSPFQKDTEHNPYFDKDWGFLREGRVIFYILDDKNAIRSIGHTPNFRVAHFNQDNRAVSPRDLVPKELMDPNFADYVDAMFGYVSESKEDGKKRTPIAYAGRVSFTSATYVSGDIQYEKEIIRILGAPKPTTFQHYLEQPEDAIKSKANLLHYGNGKRIRGYKLYWRKRVTLDTLPATEKNYTPRPKVDVPFKPLREGLTFTFRVYFENLTDAELGALAWALSLDDTADGNRHHMLGMAKPYGLGMVKLAPTLYISQRKQRYKKLFGDDGRWHEPQNSSQRDTYINVFKTALQKIGVDFNKDERIQELITMFARCVENPKNKWFSYMTIEPNEYTNRPVLPKPSEINK